MNEAFVACIANKERRIMAYNGIIKDIRNSPAPIYCTATCYTTCRVHQLLVMFSPSLYHCMELVDSLQSAFQSH